MVSSFILTTVLTRVFLFHYPVVGNFEITELRGLCSDIGKKIIDNLAECEYVAGQLGEYIDEDGSFSSYPKGCSIYKNNFYWNRHRTGGRDKQHRAICTKRGNCMLPNRE